MGFAASHITWAPQLAGLLSEGCLVCLDNRGVGASDAPQHPSAYSTTLMAEDCMAVLEALGWDSVHVVGHSMGAMVAAKLAAAWPHATASLTLISGTGGGWQAIPLSFRSLWLGLQLWMASSVAKRAALDVKFHYSPRTLKQKDARADVSRHELLLEEYLAAASQGDGSQPAHGMTVCCRGYMVLILWTDVPALVYATTSRGFHQVHVALLVDPTPKPNRNPATDPGRLSHPFHPLSTSPSFRASCRPSGGTASARRSVGPSAVRACPAWSSTAGTTSWPPPGTAPSWRGGCAPLSCSSTAPTLCFGSRPPWSMACSRTCCRAPPSCRRRQRARRGRRRTCPPRRWWRSWRRGGSSRAGGPKSDMPASPPLPPPPTACSNPAM
ncbi:hypothetical protein ACKKBG_A38120 [Auxenochlorella protothecoides x Auxenochlorella symbiontica]